MTRVRRAAVAARTVAALVGALVTSHAWAGQPQLPVSSAPKAPSCDEKQAQSKASWALNRHNDMANDFHTERTDMADTWCRIWEASGAPRRFKVGDFARVLFTGNGIHPSIAGSLVPGSGLAVGGSFQVDQHPKKMRLSEKADALFSTNGSRSFSGRLDALGNVKAVNKHFRNATIVVSRQQLAELTHFGEGNESRADNRSTFALRRTVAGGMLEVPLAPGLFVSGQVSGLWLRPSGFQGPLSMPNGGGVLDRTATAQLGTSSTYAIYGGGLRVEYPTDAVTTGYSTEFGGVVRRFQGVNDQSTSFTRTDVAWTNRYTPSTSVGSFSVATLASVASAADGHEVPIVLQPTLGGTDLNGLQVLRSFSDYRFRAPNRFVLSVEHEHEVIGPLNSLVFADWGGVATRMSDVDFRRFHGSYGAGVSLRLGNVTVFKAFYAFGGGEGTRTTFTGASDNFASTLNTRTPF